ncbi:MAG: cupin domain-containing protein [Pseudomonadota bacterium]
MADQTVIAFEPYGPAETGMQVWDPVPEEELVSSGPVQRGHEYFATAASALTAGVWDCTPMEMVMMPYPVNEFMIVLDGTIEIIDPDGNVDAFSAGDAFILPKGTPCRWRQPEYVRKYYVIFDDPSGRLASDPDKLRAIRVDLSAELPSMGAQDASLFQQAPSAMNLLPLFTDVTSQFTVGVWDCAPMHRKPDKIARSELMHILEGAGSITNADGELFSFRAGDTFMVPIGMGYEWQNTAYVKKIFCSFTPSSD